MQACKLFYEEAVPILWHKTFTFGVPAAIWSFNKRIINEGPVETFDTFKAAYLAQNSIVKPPRGRPTRLGRTKYDHSLQRAEGGIQKTWKARQEATRLEAQHRIEDLAKPLLTYRITSLRLNFLDLATEESAYISRDFRLRFEHTVESWTKGRFGLFRKPQTICVKASPMGRPVSEANNLFPCLQRLELEFPRFTSRFADQSQVGPGSMISDQGPVDFPTGLLLGILTSGWKLDELKLTALDSFKDAELLREVFEQVLLKSPPPSVHA